MIPAFLDDYAYLIEAYIQLQEVPAKQVGLPVLKNCQEWVISHFSEEGRGYFIIPIRIRMTS